MNRSRKSRGALGSADKLPQDQRVSADLIEGALPSPEVYEEEYTFWPWGKVIGLVVDILARRAGRGSVILDYMCGTGFLLNELGRMREDLVLVGCEVNSRYVEYARRVYPHLRIVRSDALIFSPEVRPDFIVCTAGLHHLPRQLQPSFVAKMAEELDSDKLLVLGEEVIGGFSSEEERRLAVLDLGSSLVKAVIESRAPDEVLEAACRLMVCDLLEIGEYKSSLPQLEAVVKPHFQIDSVYKVWPINSGPFGDVVIVCRRH